MITLTFPTAPNNIGPGYNTAFTTSLGAPGDKMNLQLVDTASGHEYTYAVVPVNGAGGWVACLGFDGVNLFSELNSGMRGTFAASSAMTLNFLQVRAGPIFVDSASFPGFSWDPEGGLYTLLQRVLLGTTGDLAAVLAAVRRTFPTT